ncbi:MAG: hypothetical protein WDN02_05105 [Methylovirgula sp.]|uniref:hypothetical protein n=1 Tax=Methylovirgula sp. TaxID=1978224 RepID=UPI003075FB03
MESITQANGSDKEVIGTVKRLMTDERAYRKFLKDVHGPAEAEKIQCPSVEAFDSFYRADQRATASSRHP